jgi:hypothetical protein
VDRDRVFGDLKRGRHQLASGLGELGRGPELDLPVFVVGSAVLGLQRCVGEEGIGVGRFHDLGPARHRGVEVAVVAQGLGRGLGDELRRALRVAHAALLRRRMVLPLHHELLARGLRVPPGVGHDGHARQQAVELGAALHHERVFHAGQGLDLVQVRARDLGREHRRLLEDRVQHARHLDVDAEEGLARDDLRVVHAGDGLADDLVVLRVLQGDGRELGRSERRGLGDELDVAERPARRLVAHGRVDRLAFRLRHAPRLRRRLDEQDAPGRAHAAQVVPVRRGARAAARVLRAVLRFLAVRLLDRDVFPVHAELLGDDLLERRLDALAALGVLGDDDDPVLGRDLDERVRREHAVRVHDRVRAVELVGEHEPAAGEERDLQEGASVDDQGGGHDAPYSSDRVERTGGSPAAW